MLKIEDAVNTMFACYERKVGDKVRVRRCAHVLPVPHLANQQGTIVQTIGPDVYKVQLKSGQVYLIHGTLLSSR